MRIAYFMDTTQIGGAERYLGDLVSWAVEAGHDVAVLSPQRDLLDFVLELAPGARPVRAGQAGYHGAPSMAARAAALARDVPAVAHALARERADAVHLNNGGYPGSDLCRLAAPVARAAAIPRRVMTVNSMAWGREDSVAGLQTAADALTWGSLHVVTTPSTRVGDSLVERRGLPRRRLRHLRYGVPEPGGREAAAELRERLAPGGELLVGMVSARPVPEKGYDVFARALARTGDDVRGVLVGPLEGLGLEALVAELGLDGRLALEGRRSPVGAYYHAIDVLVVPSTAEEAMPLVILEAMAAGKPVLGSALAGVPEAVAAGETGHLFAPGDVDGLVELLERVRANPDERAAHGRAARRRWEELFAPAAVAEATLALYDGGRVKAPSR